MAKFTKLNIGDSVASSGGRVWKKLSSMLQLSAPTLSLDGDTLTITDDSGLATSFDILVDGVVKATATSTSFDLSALGLADGTYSISVIAKADGHTDSAESEAVSYAAAVELAGTWVFNTALSLPNAIADLYNGVIKGTCYGPTSVNGSTLVFGTMTFNSVSMRQNDDDKSFTSSSYLPNGYVIVFSTSSNVSWPHYFVQFRTNFVDYGRHQSTITKYYKPNLSLSQTSVQQRTVTFNTTSANLIASKGQDSYDNFMTWLKANATKTA